MSPVDIGLVAILVAAIGIILAWLHNRREELRKPRSLR